MKYEYVTVKIFLENIIGLWNNIWIKSIVALGRPYIWYVIVRTLWNSELHVVVVTLPQVFQIAYVIVKAANSPRPGNWILERSLDDVDYKPWQYHAVTDTECLTLYNIHPRTGPPSYAKDDEVICTSFYSKIHPLENGEVRWENSPSVHLRCQNRPVIKTRIYQS